MNSENNSKTSFSNFALSLLILISFGPFVIKSISIQIIDIGLIFFFLYSLSHILRSREPNKYSYDFIIYSLILVVLFISSIINLINLSPSFFLGSLNRFLQFFFVYIVCIYFNDFSILSIYKYFLIALTFNSIVILLQFQDNVLFNFFSTYWYVDFSESVSFRAAQLGRLTGVIKQPLEAGLAYSFGLFSIIYLYIKTRKLTFFFYLPLVLFGGFISISKVFILVGLPLAILFFLINSNFKKNVIFFIFSFFIFFIFLLLIESWEAGSYLLRLFDMSNIEGGGIGFLTASRFGGENTDVEELFSSVLFNSPILGFGIGSTQLLDNAFIEFLYQGGIIALFLYLLLMIFYIYKSFKIKEKLDRSYMLILFVFIILSSIGAPIFTYSRFSTFLVATLFFFTNKNSSRTSYSKNSIV